MDWTIIAVIVGVALLLAAITLWMLNRAWGADFPGSSMALPPELFEQPERRLRRPVPSEQPEDESAPWWADTTASHDLPAGSPTDDMIEVTHPVVRQAIKGALERGGSPYATFFIRDDDQIYLALHRIQDPAQRASAQRVVQDLNSGSIDALSLMDMLRTLRP